MNKRYIEGTILLCVHLHYTVNKLDLSPSYIYVCTMI